MQWVRNLKHDTSISEEISLKNIVSNSQCEAQCEASLIVFTCYGLLNAKSTRTCFAANRKAAKHFYPRVRAHSKMSDCNHVAQSHNVREKYSLTLQEV